MVELYRARRIQQNDGYLARHPTPIKKATRLTFPRHCSDFASRPLYNGGGRPSPGPRHPPPIFLAARHFFGIISRSALNRFRPVFFRRCVVIRGYQAAYWLPLPGFTVSGNLPLIYQGSGHLRSFGIPPKSVIRKKTFPLAQRRQDLYTRKVET